MNDLVRPALFETSIRDQDADYFCIRVVDTLLRENLRDCISHGEIVDSAALPDAIARHYPENQRWLRATHLNGLWIPVTEENYMQSWRLSRLPLLRETSCGFAPLFEVNQVLAAFRSGLTPEAAQPYLNFEHECRAALEHRRASEAERLRWFGESREQRLHGPEQPRWDARLLHYDRLAAYLDHPYYPTARAKLGFTAADLAEYAPEFAPRFELNWLAVPRELFHPSGDALPPGWPSFSDVGLPQELAASHTLLPVHPFLWQHHLDDFLLDTGFAGQVLRAPRHHLAVTPTLSVRTLVLCDAPAWHIKLPLTIRTLGAKNIRTIKPSTIGDGHRIQSLLGAIAAREPALAGRVLLTNEEIGAHVDLRPFLGYIVRRYPEAELADATLVSVAGLLAEAPHGGSVLDGLVARYYGGELDAFFDAYLDLTLRLHLTLWLRYGVALESNQQNSMLAFSDTGLRLLLKDNDAARIQRDTLDARWPQLAALVAELEDARIVVDSEQPLAQMFITITLQLNLAAPIAGIAQRLGQPAAIWHQRVAERIATVLNELAAAGENATLARQVLLEADTLPIKYLLSAATLLDKAETGARDVNKFYGDTAPNFLKAQQ
jgi:siderophore synthetase component